ncbi:MAG: LysM peptidoglycan-binding domain-containing protein [Lachnospiraceae bacterium]|nr:LysM peptidoglycan-binding domain-containing protein [Lachnospiraceae bacterium]
MIEVVKEGKFPKNIRQIGQVSGNQKVYLEDYVITYLKQIPSPEDGMRVIILYGKKEMLGDELCWFVNGAVGAEKDFFMEKTVIDQESWQRVNEMAGRFFPEQTVLGWAIVTNESTKEIEEQILRTQKQFFRPDQKLYFEYNTEEKEEYIYLYEKGKMRRQGGYYIYYERNECMQNYMVSLRAAERHPEEFEADRATHQFREVVSEKKQEIHRRRSATLMTCVSLVLMMVIMVIGITMLNNYEKMQNMEQVLYQISGKIDQNTEVEEAADLQESEEVVAEGVQESVLSESVAQENAAGESVQESLEKEPVQDEVAEAAPSVSREELAQSAEEESTGQEISDGGDADEAVSESEPENAEESADTQMEEESVSVSSEKTTYVIQKGDTLAKICLKYYGNLSNIDIICEWNGIEDKDNIFYGQKILLP